VKFGDREPQRKAEFHLEKVTDDSGEDRNSGGVLDMHPADELNISPRRSPRVAARIHTTPPRPPAPENANPGGNTSRQKRVHTTPPGVYGKMGDRTRSPRRRKLKIPAKFSHPEARSDAGEQPSDRPSRSPATSGVEIVPIDEPAEGMEDEPTPTGRYLPIPRVEDCLNCVSLAGRVAKLEAQLEAQLEAHRALAAQWAARWDAHQKVCQVARDGV